MYESFIRRLPRPRVTLAIGAVMLFSLSVFYSTDISSAVSNSRPHYNVNQDVCSGFKHFNCVQADHSTAGMVKNRLAKSESLYQKQLIQRDMFLNSHGYGQPGFSPWANSEGQQPWWWYFQPAFNCPHEVERIGRINDGGKWVCGMSVLERPSAKKCVIYSLGVFDDSSFEAAMMERTNCEVWAFDGSVDGVAGDARGNPRIHFSKVFLGCQDKVENGYVFKTLPTIMKENGHTWIDVLKIDIEGYEFQVLTDLMNAYEGKILPFSQLQIEFHLYSADMGTDAAGFTRFKAWFERLEKFQLRPFWSELNLIPILNTPNTLPGYIEYCFINTAGDHSLLHD